MGKRTHGKTTEIVINEIKQVHGDKFLLDRVDYKNCNTKILIGCHTHGYFEKWPNDIKKPNGGCPRCNNSWFKTHDEFVSEVKQKYPHLRVVGKYKNSRTKLKFECSKHNTLFDSTPNGILTGHVNCDECIAEKSVLSKLSNSKSVTDPALKTDLEKYRRAVWRFSNRTYRQRLSEVKRDRHNHLDHILSIIEGFVQNIPPEIMGSIHNLRIISGKKNRQKSYRSELTANELIERYNRDNEKTLLYGFGKL